MSKPIEGVSVKIETCAKKEFLDKGYVDASLRTIAAEAGTTTGSIYSRYGGKEGLFSALVEPAAKEFTEIFVSVQEKFQKIEPEKQADYLDEYAENGMMLMLDYMYDNDTKFFEEYHGRYYAPEQRYIADYVDERADIYSMVRIMYELLAGYENCDKYNIEPYIEKLDKEVPDMLKRIIEKCMKHDPTERFQTFMELKEALCKCNNIIKFF